MTEPPADLTPAVFEEDEERAFAPKRPWKWIGLGAAGLALVVGFYQWRDRSRQAQLRASIQAAFMGDLGDAAQRVNGFRVKLEGWIQQVAPDVPENFVHPSFNLSGLHQASGVYLRMHADSVTEDPMSIRDSALTMEPDSIGSCLGLSPLSLRGLYERIEFLQPIWLEDAMAADTVLGLRVFQDELERRSERDVPLLLDIAEADYFMLVLQHGENRREHPVDVYVWDIKRDTLLLKGRVQSRGTLIPARIAIGTHAGRARPLDQRAAVSDCSIAAQVREIAGRGGVEVESEMPMGRVVERGEDVEEAAEDTTAEEGAANTEGEATSEGEPGSGVGSRASETDG
ncbi:MAG: hypothetical protein AAF938_30380 [Myxococcota bacterium]